MSYDRAAELYDGAEPDEGVDAPECDRCNGPASMFDAARCDCVEWRCADDECGGRGTVRYCRRCSE